jgi:hypothetical protein
MYIFSGAFCEHMDGGVLVKNKEGSVAFWAEGALAVTVLELLPRTGELSAAD